MKKRSLFALCIIAIASVALLASCFMQDPIADNKAIGKWTAQNNMGDKITLDVKSDQTLVMTLEQASGESDFLESFGLSGDSLVITVTGKWDATSVSEGTMTLDELKTEYSFTAYEDVLTLYNSQMGKIEFSRM